MRENRVVVRLSIREKNGFADEWHGECELDREAVDAVIAKCANSPRDDGWGYVRCFLENFILEGIMGWAEHVCSKRIEQEKRPREHVEMLSEMLMRAEKHGRSL